MLRRWRGAWPRRGHFYGVPPAEVVTAAPAYIPPFVEPAGPRPRGPRLTRRGSFFPVGPLALPPPAAISPAGRPRLRLARRGQHFEPPWVQGPQNVWTAAIEGPGRRARWLPPARRGEFLTVPVPVVAAAPPVWVPQPARARRAALPGRRGRFYGPVFSPSPLTDSGLALGVGSAGRPGRRFTLARRGQFFELPPTAAAAPPPGWAPPFRATQAPVRRSLPLRRGRYTALPPAPAGTPAWLRARPRPAPSLRRRRRFHEPPWVQGPQTLWRPGVVRPAGARPRWPSHRPRRGQTWFVPVPPPPPFSIGALTARDAASGVLTAAGATAGLTAADTAAGRLGATDDELGRLDATDQRGGPS